MTYHSAHHPQHMQQQHIPVSLSLDSLSAMHSAADYDDGPEVDEYEDDQDQEDDQDSLAPLRSSASGYGEVLPGSSNNRGMTNGRKSNEKQVRRRSSKGKHCLLAV